MARPSVPADGALGWSTGVRNAIFDVSDRADAALAAGGGSGVAGLLLVASVDAPAAIKAGASYVCDGVDDQVQIQAAIDRAAPLLSKNSGMTAAAQQLGEVKLTGGTFAISAPIQMRTGTVLRGSGWLTELKQTGNTGTAAIKLAAPSAHVVHIRDLWINGNSTAGGTADAINFDMTASGDTSSYPFANPDSYNLVDTVYVTGHSNGTRNGIKFWADGTANNRGNIISNIQMRDCSGNGIWYSASSDSFINTCHIGGTDGDAYRIETGNTRITHCKSFYTDGRGFYIASGRHTVTNCEAQDDATGFLLTADDSTYGNLIADTCLNDGIVIDNGGMDLIGFEILLRGAARYPTQANGLRFVGTPTDVMIMGRVKPANITSPITGTAGARSFMRVTNGTSVVGVG